MARPIGSKSTPSYRERKDTGKAVVTIDGHDYYLGDYGTKESRAEYDRLIGEWLANGRRMPTKGRKDPHVSEVLAAFWTHAKLYYRKPDGTPTSEQSALRIALAPVRRLYGHKLASEFGPLALKAIAEEMIRLNYCRKSINIHLGRIRHAWKWAAASELIEPSFYHALTAVAGLRAGRTEARESEPVRPVPEAYVTAILTHLSQQVRTIIDLQLITGMRPGEVCQMRTGDIDTTGRLWVYRPASHKTMHHGHERTIYLGPRAIEIVRPWLRPNLSEYLFRPDEAEAVRRQKLSNDRTTPEGYGNAPGTNRTKRPKKGPGDRYTVSSYRRAIAGACDLAFPLSEQLARQKLKVGKKRVRWETKKQWRIRIGDEQWAAARQWLATHRWHPHQLRHNAATRLRKDYGLEAAQVILGHKTLSVTEIYAEKNVAAAQRIMSEVG